MRGGAEGTQLGSQFACSLALTVTQQETLGVSTVHWTLAPEAHDTPSWEYQLPTKRLHPGEIGKWRRRSIPEGGKLIQYFIK